MKTSKDETRQILKECRALLSDDHFVYISGDHGSGWVAKDIIFVDLARVRRLGQLLAEAVRRFDAEILCGPATGGLIVAQWTAHELGIPAVFAEHDPAPKKSELRGRFGLHRGYDKLVRGKRVVVVDDVVNTGLSVRQTGQRFDLDICIEAQKVSNIVGQEPVNVVGEHGGDDIRVVNLLSRTWYSGQELGEM